MLHNRNPNGGRSAFNRGSDLIATTSGVVATAAIGPIMYAESIGAIRGYAADHYPWLWDWIITLFWAVISGVATFAMTTLVLSVSVRIVLAKLSMTIFRN